MQFFGPFFSYTLVLCRRFLPPEIHRLTTSKWKGIRTGFCEKFGHESSPLPLEEEMKGHSFKYCRTPATANANDDDDQLHPRY